jgi:adenine-specific DNA-methyltransferase
LFYTDKLKKIDDRWVAGEPLTTLWDDILSNNLHAEGGVEFPKGKKPEALIKRVLELGCVCKIVEPVVNAGVRAGPCSVQIVG